MGDCPLDRQVNRKGHAWRQPRPGREKAIRVLPREGRARAETEQARHGRRRGFMVTPDADDNELRHVHHAPTR